jgi:hypothetical protein
MKENWKGNERQIYLLSERILLGANALIVVVEGLLQNGGW